MSSPHFTVLRRETAESGLAKEYARRSGGGTRELQRRSTSFALGIAEVDDFIVVTHRISAVLGPLKELFDAGDFVEIRLAALRQKEIENVLRLYGAYWNFGDLADDRIEGMA